MARHRSLRRRRFVSLVGIAALAGCVGGEGAGTGAGGAEVDGNASDEANESGDGPEIERANLFVEVVDGEGVPVPGATVTVVGGEHDGSEFETDPGGTVVLREVDPGEYVITATTEAGEDEREVTVEEGEDAELTLTVPTAGVGGAA